MIPTANRELVTSKILLGDGPFAVPEQVVSGQVQVLEINVYSELNKIPYATIKLADGSAADSDFEISNRGDFALGKSIEIQLGYNTDDQSVFRGIVICNSHIVQGNKSILLVTCKHEAVKMTVSPKSRHFNEITDSEVVEQILQDNGLSEIDIQAFGNTQEQLLQANVTDWDFMIGRIDTNGMACLIDGSELKVIKPDPSLNPVLDLIFGTNILSFRADSDIRSQATAVKAFSWDYANQTVLEAEGATLDSASPGNIQGSTLAEINGQEFEIRSSGKFSNESLQSLADAKKNKQSLSKIKGKIAFGGNADVKPGEWLNLAGIGDQFNGKAFVSAVQHEVSQGNWVTEAVLGWEEDFFTEKFNSSSISSASGQYSRIQGLHIGIVTDIIDPLGEGRVKVRLPLVNPNDAGIFARVSTLDAGDTRGTFFRPEVDDEVIVGFINDDPSQPVILGMIHSSAKPTPFEPENNNDKKGYVSRSEIKITIHDGDKSIVIETPGERKFTLDDAAGIIQVEDATGNRLTMDDSGIVLDSPMEISLKAGSKISFAAPEIALKADMKISAEASAGLSFKSNGTADFEGSLVNIKGSLVKIN
ncbi:type VI secretion system tip protein VgrG [Algoriphagus resistens]|uniref:type VI secretion system tip protein VgrG n=1 Tax=Algoriphagus resistens TaxID=1750590 RepID=UPI0007169286|nr:type VI secretion system tip protein VgrG [Algoriphagus resistens]